MYCLGPCVCVCACVRACVRVRACVLVHGALYGGGLRCLGLKFVESHVYHTFKQQLPNQDEQVFHAGREDKRTLNMKSHWYQVKFVDVCVCIQARQLVYIIRYNYCAHLMHNN